MMRPANYLSILVCVCLLVGSAAGDLPEANLDLLLSPNLRLAAMGNPYLVVEDWHNEMNAYDFGQLPAGIVTDNQSRSWASIDASYGFGPLVETWMYTRKSRDAGLGASGACHLGQRTAISGRLSCTNHDFAYQRLYGTHQVWHNEYREHSDSLTAGFRAGQLVTLGLRGIYNDIWEKRGSSYRRTEELWSVEPSILLSPPEAKIQYGLHGRLYQYGHSAQTATALHFSLPLIYTAPALSLGTKLILCNLDSRPTYADFPIGPLLTLGLAASIRRWVDVGNSALCIAVHAAANDYTATMLFSEDRPSWLLDFGLGLAYTDNQTMTLGIQYLPSIGEGPDYLDDVRREQSVNLGAEFYPLRELPVRVGLARLSAQSGAIHYFVEQMLHDTFLACDAVTAGCGVRWPTLRLEVDLAYNLLIFDHEYDDTELKHLFGLSTRIVF